MRNYVKRAIPIVLLTFACMIGSVERSAPVYGQEVKAVEKAEEKDGEAPKGPSGLFDNPILPLLVVMVLFFFFIILPAQRRQKREQESILANLKKNDEVVTAAGIIGVVANIKDNEDEVTLKIDDNARIKVLKSSIVRIRTKEVPKETTAIAPGTPPNTNAKA